ncbi:hypothetical protein [uncultured Senegalimassilia sp.]|uniref:hypothetical protein n=1 Tax=uncultured Senegalimassilia sp. TaxID=1714350 RepID=UPI002673B91E|nr:hypothetical protein [uncultured Senegalimassilia sp.]
MAVDEQTELAASGSVFDLAAQSAEYEPLSYYGGAKDCGDAIDIEYISDVHLLHHVKYYGEDLRKAINGAAGTLAESHAEPKFVLHRGWIAPKSFFLGDVSSDKEVTVEFYRRYRLNVMYREYRRFRAELAKKYGYGRKSMRWRLNAERSLKSLDGHIAAKEAEFKRLKAKVDEYLSYNRVIAPKGNADRIKAYLASDYYKKREQKDGLPYSVRERILDAAAAKDEVCRLEFVKADLERRLEDERFESHMAFTETERPYDLRGFRTYLIRRYDNWCNMQKGGHYRPHEHLGIVILGNHEYVGFPDVDSAVAFYKERLEPMGYTVLQNEYVEDDRCVIYGGTGFAVLNECYNAGNLVCCDAMMVDRELFVKVKQGVPGAEDDLEAAKARARAYEAEQSRLFVAGYEAAREHARETDKCFVCATHYPVEGCLGRLDRDAVYFSGHTHQNRYVRKENVILYADNQVGCHKRGGFDPERDMRFRTATAGCVRNPYADLVDGCYPTTPAEYSSFYRFIGEYVGTGKMIRKSCKKNEMYVIKSYGYYGFFLVSDKGISIANGGKTKKVALSGSIDWVCDNFDIVVAKYLAALEPLRERQEQVSRELKRLGFYGTIHGLIVDVNFDHHIMVNPADGSLAFYSSPSYGLVDQLASFPKLLESVKQGCLLYGNELVAASVEERCDAALAKYDVDVLAPSPLGMLAPVDAEGIEALERAEMIKVDLKHGAYKLSRNVAPLQRLFSGHVLRDFDPRLAEVDDESTPRRKRSMLGRAFVDEFGTEHLIVEDDLGEVITALSEDGRRMRVTVLALRRLVRGGGRWVTKTLDATLAAYADKSLPKPWGDALSRMKPKVLDASK